jgi:hypothetical protein
MGMVCVDMGGMAPFAGGAKKYICVDQTGDQDADNEESE